MWRREFKANSPLLCSIHGVRARSRPFPIRQLSGSPALRYDPKHGYFQGDGSPNRQGSPSQISHGNGTGPIYVLPNALHDQGEGSRTRLRWAEKLLYVTIGAAIGTALLEAAFPAVRTRDKAKKGVLFQRQDSDPDEIADSLELEEEEDDDEDADSEYVEDDGTETHRVRRTARLVLPSSEVLALEKDIVLQKLWNLRETVEKDRHISQLNLLLDSANASQLRTHMQLINMVTGPCSDRAFVDQAVLESRPIYLPDDTRVDADKASLIRVLDAEGKNKLIILGVDLDFHQSNQEVASRWPSDCYRLDAWLHDLANEFERLDQNAPDLAIFLYSNRCIVDVSYTTGDAWQTRYRQSDFPPGFPLAQLRQIKRVTNPKSNLVHSNLQKVQAPGPGKDAP